MTLMPQAFVYDYDGVEGNLVRIKFRPNPVYIPPTYEARVIHSLAGTILIDSEHKRLASVAGQLPETDEEWDVLARRAVAEQRAAGREDRGVAAFLAGEVTQAGHVVADGQRGAGDHVERTEGRVPLGLAVGQGSLPGCA